MASAALPHRIHHYRVLDELGHGAMGRVYLVEDLRLERKVALKVLEPRLTEDGAADDDLDRRFLVEARAAGRLAHPGIVTLFDADTDPESGRPYLVMEWVRGRPLSHLLEAEGPLPVDRAVDLAGQVAQALAYAHRQGVVHRDVKPANLMVADDGTVKVTDFGIAELKVADATQPGRAFGSPFYMAPEQVAGKPVDGRADLFALGSVLYECLTGERAFTGDSLDKIAYKIVSVDPRPVEIYNPAVTKELRAVLDRMLAKDPDKRYPTGDELALTLRGLARRRIWRPTPPPAPRRRVVGRISERFTIPIPGLVIDPMPAPTPASTRFRVLAAAGAAAALGLAFLLTAAAERPAPADAARPRLAGFVELPAAAAVAPPDEPPPRPFPPLRFEPLPPWPAVKPPTYQPYAEPVALADGPPTWPRVCRLPSPP